MSRKSAVEVSAPFDVTLVNAERAPEHRPATSPERLDEHAGYWPGPVSLHALHWRAGAQHSAGDRRGLAEGVAHREVARVRSAID
jgi:hypothetical protein